LSIWADKPRNMVIIQAGKNRYELGMGEFKIVGVEEKKRTPVRATHSTGTALVNGQVVTVSVPTGTVGGDFVSTGRYEIKIYQYPDGDSANPTELLFIIRHPKFFYALKELSTLISDFFIGNRKDSAAKIAQVALDNLIRQAGMADDYFQLVKWNGDGVLSEVIAVDRSGKAVIFDNNGENIWMGSLNGASAEIAGTHLDVKVDDPVYREQKLSERHFIILGGEPRDVLVAWEERINLIAKKLAE